MIAGGKATEGGDAEGSGFSGYPARNLASLSVGSGGEGGPDGKLRVPYASRGLANL
jgi:hypothetical protein